MKFKVVKSASEVSTAAKSLQKEANARGSGKAATAVPHHDEVSTTGSGCPQRTSCPSKAGNTPPNLGVVTTDIVSASTGLHPRFNPFGVDVSFSQNRQTPSHASLHSGFMPQGISLFSPPYPRQMFHEIPALMLHTSAQVQEQTEQFEPRDAGNKQS